MAKYDEKMRIPDLPFDVHRELIDELSRDLGWIVLARYIADEYDIFSLSWMNDFEREQNPLDSRRQIQKLFDELDKRLCNVGNLCILLENCELLNALSVLCYPEPLTIVKQPKSELGKDNAMIAPHKGITLSCKATSLPPPQYLWYHNNVELENETNGDLNIVVTSTTQEGEYKCQVMQRDRDGYLMRQLFSDTFYLKIKPLPVVIIEQPREYIEVKEGGTLILTCKAIGHPEPRYQWFRDNILLNGQDSIELRINDFSVQDEDVYRCYIVNEISSLYSNSTTVKMEQTRCKAVAKVALLIANSDYTNFDPVKKAKNDAALIARLLEDIGFNVICLSNLTVNQMRNAINIFCKLLSEGVYGLFYFAGHGFNMQDNYMLAVDSPKKYLRTDAICDSQLLAMAHLETDPTLLVVILDMCLIVPSRDDNPEIHKEIPIIYEYKSKKNRRNLIRAYSTSRHCPSYERKANDFGLYVTHLSKYIKSTVPVTKMFKQVQISLEKTLKGRERDQIPQLTSIVVKPYRLTDMINEAIKSLSTLITFPTRTILQTFTRLGVECKITVGSFELPYLNIVRIAVAHVNNYEVSFRNRFPTDPNNLYSFPGKNECILYNPQTSKGRVIISICRNGNELETIEFNMNDYIPCLLHELEQACGV
ncbi:mucosa-associated lymphoid tissue lymphoma translocation protein 1 isoform X2 [Cephus cinctus]|uniref:Mucosa-associated lymphoid tissue lymphoma translocation protein 1 isoform X2 n=1 Tax=Cephus cinctus TaxID=211228 RepID=A0AAJ7R8M6_CEPCN|nr:mucosa-associated lymphoid tissue lymphoma translocation protein 1 isoform X2 [Cephus cinctus]